MVKTRVLLSSVKVFDVLTTLVQNPCLSLDTTVLLECFRLGSRMLSARRLKTRPSRHLDQVPPRLSMFGEHRPRLREALVCTILEL